MVQRHLGQLTVQQQDPAAAAAAAVQQLSLGSNSNGVVRIQQPMHCCLISWNSQVLQQSSSLLQYRSSMPLV
jgi:hypothetical protein